MLCLIGAAPICATNGPVVKLDLSHHFAKVKFLGSNPDWPTRFYGYIVKIDITTVFETVSSGATPDVPTRFILTCQENTYF